MTVQFTERLVHGGATHMLCTLPLDTYLETMQKRELLADLHRHTACCRGYVGFWEIRDGMLFLTRLGTLQDDDFPLEVLFPGVQVPVFAGWFTGELRCPQGKLLKYVHMDFRSTYECDLLITVKDGAVEMERVVVNPPPPPPDPPEEFNIPAFLKRQKE